MTSFLRISAIASIVIVAACNTSKKTTTTNVINLDTVAVTPTAKVPEYRASATRLTDIIHTKLEVSFNWDKKYLLGKATITAKPYFYPQSNVMLDARGMDIKEVSLIKNEAILKLDYKYENDVLTIALNKNYSRTDTFKLYIEYTAKPDELGKVGGSAAIKSDKGLYFINADGSDKEKPQQIWTQGETQANSVWFPTVDRSNEKMTQEIFITIDKKYTTLSNGELVYQKENADGTRTDYWKMDLPHTPYLAMMAIGEFAIVKDKWRGKEVNYYVEKQNEQYARAVFGKTPEMLEFFSNKLGVQYAWNKYSQVVVRDYVSGAMENTSATLHGEFVQQTPREMIDNTFEDVVSHELFHQWFGDLVTCESWSNLPLNESFATYGEYLWREYKYGRDDADSHGREDLEKYLKESKRKNENLIRFTYKDKEDMFDSHSYEKGGRVLHMLRKYLGDDAFFNGLKLYLETNKFTAVEIHQLRLAFEQVSGEDLNWFFNQWFLSAGHPELEITHSYNADTKKAVVIVEQLQDLKTTPLYKLPIDIDIYANGQVKRERITLTKQKDTLVFEASVKPNLINFDAEKMLLGVKYESNKTAQEWAFQYKNAPLYQDRLDALFGLVKYKKEPEFKEIFMLALSDKYWEIRTAAISGLGEILAGNEAEIKQKLINIVQNDKRSLTRADAIYFLADNYTDADLIPVYKQKLSDSSYTVLSETLNALKKVSPTEAAAAAKTLEKEENKSIVLSVLDIYSKEPNEEHHDYFIKKASLFTGFWAISYIDVYGKFLETANESIIDKALPIIEKYARNESNFVAFYGKKVIQDLKARYEKEIEAFYKKQKESLTGLNAAETAVASKRVVQLDEILKKLESEKAK